MCSMMFGSMLYNNITKSSSPFPAQRVLTGTLIVASFCFFIPGHFRDERITLWCFCLFELCCGIYYPVMASLKGKLIEDGSRATVYTLLRIPLNAFVVLALSTTKEGMISQFMTKQSTANSLRRDSSRCGVHNLQRATIGGRVGCTQDFGIERGCRGFRFVRRSVFVSIELEIDIVFEWSPATDVLRKVPLFFC
jgi:hypothetical protein